MRMRLDGIAGALHKGRLEHTSQVLMTSSHYTQLHQPSQGRDPQYATIASHLEERNTKIRRRPFLSLFNANSACGTHANVGHGYGTVDF